MPTIRSIQLTNLVLVLVAAGAMAYFVSTAAAIGCLLGGAVVVAQFVFACGAWTVRAGGGGQSGGVSKVGLAALPAKMR